MESKELGPLLVSSLQHSCNSRICSQRSAGWDCGSAGGQKGSAEGSGQTQ
ncbi:hypothetical protein Nmel_018543 [Mimus melanotis]